MVRTAYGGGVGLFGMAVLAVVDLRMMDCCGEHPKTVRHRNPAVLDRQLLRQQTRRLLQYKGKQRWVHTKAMQYPVLATT